MQLEHHIIVPRSISFQLYTWKQCYFSRYNYSLTRTMTYGIQYFHYHWMISWELILKIDQEIDHESCYIADTLIIVGQSLRGSPNIKAIVKMT